MEKQNIFYKKCPKNGCNTISGFWLPIKEINANKKYFCQECGKESPLNKWKESNQNYMNSQIRARKYIKMGKIDKNTPSREIRDTIRHVGKYKKDSKKDNMFIIRDLKEIKDELN